MPFISGNYAGRGRIWNDRARAISRGCGPWECTLRPQPLKPKTTCRSVCLRPLIKFACNAACTIEGCSIGMTPHWPTTPGPLRTHPGVWIYQNPEEDRFISAIRRMKLGGVTIQELVSENEVTLVIVVLAGWMLLFISLTDIGETSAKLEHSAGISPKLL